MTNFVKCKIPNEYLEENIVYEVIEEYKNFYILKFKENYIFDKERFEKIKME